MQRGCWHDLLLSASSGRLCRKPQIHQLKLCLRSPKFLFKIG